MIEYAIVSKDEALRKDISLFQGFMIHYKRKGL